MNQRIRELDTAISDLIRVRDSMRLTEGDLALGARTATEIAKARAECEAKVQEIVATQLATWSATPPAAEPEVPTEVI